LNGETQSYHVTIMRCSVRAVRLQQAASGEGGLFIRVNTLLTCRFGQLPQVGTA
jgi:hypothetical protein